MAELCAPHNPRRLIGVRVSRPRPLYPSQAMGFFAVGHGMYAFFAVPLQANMLAFGPRRAGAVSGFLLTGFGGSAAVFAQASAGRGRAIQMEGQ